jgi:hypothetical protein
VGIIDPAIAAQSKITASRILFLLVEIAERDPAHSVGNGP